MCLCHFSGHPCELTAHRETCVLYFLHGLQPGMAVCGRTCLVAGLLMTGCMRMRAHPPAHAWFCCLCIHVPRLRVIWLDAGLLLLVRGFVVVWCGLKSVAQHSAPARSIRMSLYGISLLLGAAGIILSPGPMGHTTTNAASQASYVNSRQVRSTCMRHP